MRWSQQLDNLRFWSIFGIVALHCYGADAFLTQQLFKFGSIGLFLAAGVLLGAKTSTQSPALYLKNRLARVGQPWVFWTAGFAGLLYTVKLLTSHPLTLWQTIIEVLTRTEYWYVPNFLFALTVLVSCWRFLDRWWLGICLGSLSLLYAVNLYQDWFLTAHTTAILGYVFYLWIGYQAAQHQAVLIRWLERLPVTYFLLGCVLVYVLALLEGQRLGPDALSTLKFTNQLYSLAIFFLFLRWPGKLYPVTAQPRQTSFGLYLVHWPILSMLTWSLLAVGIRIEQLPLGMQGIAWAIKFMLVYGLSFALVRHLASSPLAPLVGQTPPARLPVAAD